MEFEVLQTSRTEHWIPSQGGYSRECRYLKPEASRYRLGSTRDIAQGSQQREENCHYFLFLAIAMDLVSSSKKKKDYARLTSQKREKDSIDDICGLYVSIDLDKGLC
jgi:hypothetical protein